MSKLAIDGGTPVRSKMLPYGRQAISERDIEAVVQVLRSDWLTTGPNIESFEKEFARITGAAEAVAVSSGTAALHCAMFAADVRPDDEVIVSTMTFAASANSIVYRRGKPVFADVDAKTLLIDPACVEKNITPRTKGIVAVDYAGQPCDYDSLRALAKRHGLFLISDACHSLGGSYGGQPVGNLADLTCFSFHPVKIITTGEGGMITTNDPEKARAMRSFRNHGINTDFRQREKEGSYFYEMVHEGYNYRLTDIQCALGLSQLRELPGWTRRRQEIAARYDAAFTSIPGMDPLARSAKSSSAFHLYVVAIDPTKTRADRKMFFNALRAEGIGVNVHYMPVHLHPFYRTNFGTGPGLCPVAEDAYNRILSLPMFPAMTDADVQDVIDATTKVAKAYSAEA